MRSGGATGPKSGESNYGPGLLGHPGFQAAKADYLACPWKKIQGGTFSGIKWAVVLCSHPLLSHRHVARPTERRHDCHHVHSGLPALLPARGLRWSHHPQLCVSSAAGRGGAWRQGDTPLLPRKGLASGSSELGSLPWCW